MSDHQAERKAIDGFGAPGRLARRLDPFVLPSRWLLILMSFATVLVGLWLLFVITAVLPSLDPAHIPLWRAVAGGCFAYSALTWVYLIRGPRVVWLRPIVLGGSSIAVALGGYGIADMIRIEQSGGHFEGYIVLMGLILAGHGLAALLYTALTRGVARRANE